MLKKEKPMKPHVQNQKKVWITKRKKIILVILAIILLYGFYIGIQFYRDFFTPTVDQPLHIPTLK